MATYTCKGCKPIDASIIDAYVALIGATENANNSAANAGEATTAANNAATSAGNAAEQATNAALSANAAAAAANAAGITQAEASVDSNTGTPSVDVSLVNKKLSLSFHNIKGEKGDKGDRGDGAVLVINDLVTGGTDAALSAEMGKTLNNTKQETLVSGTNIKTVNGESLLGEGNIIAGDPNAVKYVEQTLTDAQKTQARTNIGAYQKPDTGIPATDLASAAQTSLGKADTAYQKPSAGIPKLDLESGVQASLDLADSAIQARPMGEVDPTITPADYATKEELDELEAEVDGLFGPSPADLDIADEDGNVIARFKDGHIKTKEFDSSKTATTSKNGLMSASDKAKLNAIENGAEANDIKADNTLIQDLSIVDSNNNILTRFSNGHIKTKNFDSSAVTLSNKGIADLQICDGNGGMLLELTNGGVRTRNFYSEECLNTLNTLHTEVVEKTPDYISAEQYNQIPVDKCSYAKISRSAVSTVHKGKITRNYDQLNFIARIALFGDLHVGYGYSFKDVPLGNYSGYGWKNWEDYIELSLKRASNKIPDFGIALGDQLSSINDNMYNRGGVGLVERNDYYNRLRGFNYPLFNIFGNHDEAVPDFTHTGVIEIKNVRIIVAHMYMASVIPPSFNISDAEYEWLESAIIDSYNNGFITVLVSHYPIIGDVWTDNNYPENYFGHLVVNTHGQDLVDLCQNYNVRLHIHGHYHATGLPYRIMNNNGVNFDMTEVELGLGAMAYVILEIRDDGFHFTEYPLTRDTGSTVENNVYLHTFETIDDTAGRTLFIPFLNQEAGIVRSDDWTPKPGVEHE